ncbi:MAG: polymerase, sigma 32 subunit, RpoH, partial [Geminicoccaceae bacterium]|nr:polymerase, sigma 32 subunit, RpoH [Geminicoccaceae bacterium]
MAFMDTPASLKVDREFIRESMSAALLSREREQMLARLWRDHDDEVALHELVMAYMRLVISTASRFRNYGLPMADLVQEGAAGLMQAAARFEPEREVRFSTYAA